MNIKNPLVLGTMTFVILAVPAGVLQLCGRTPVASNAMAVTPPPRVATVTEGEIVTTSLSRRDIPPGDPIISVNAPADARHVTAYFPFGLTKELRYDAIQKTWRGRFLVPAGIPDGDYPITVGIELHDGKRTIVHERYRLDSTEPEFVASFTQDVMWPGEVASISVDTVEPAADVYVHCPTLGWHRVNLLPAHRGSTTHFRLDRMLPDDTEPGEYLVLVVTRDLAGNRYEQFLLLNIVPLPLA